MKSIVKPNLMFYGIALIPIEALNQFLNLVMFTKRTIELVGEGKVFVGHLQMLPMGFRDLKSDIASLPQVFNSLLQPSKQMTLAEMFPAKQPKVEPIKKPKVNRRGKR